MFGIGHRHRRYNFNISAPCHRFFCAYPADGVERVVASVTAGFQQDFPAFHVDVAVAIDGFAVLVFSIYFHVAVEMGRLTGEDAPMIGIQLNYGFLPYKNFMAIKARHGLIGIVIVGGGLT